MKKVFSKVLHKLCQSRTKEFFRAKFERDLALSKKVVDSDQSLRDNLKGQTQGQLITSHNYFHGCSIFWKTLFSLPSLLECLTFVLILSTGDCNVHISEQLFYRVKDLMLCCRSTSYILFEAFLSFGIKHAL